MSLREPASPFWADKGMNGKHCENTGHAVTSGPPHPDVQGAGSCRSRCSNTVCLRNADPSAQSPLPAFVHRQTCHGHSLQAWPVPGQPFTERPVHRQVHVPFAVASLGSCLRTWMEICERCASLMDASDSTRTCLCRGRD